MTDWTWTPELAAAVAITPALLAGAAIWWHGYREGEKNAARTFVELLPAKPAVTPWPAGGGDDV